MSNKIFYLVVMLSFNYAVIVEAEFKEEITKCFNDWKLLPNKPFTKDFEVIARNKIPEIKGYVNEILSNSLGNDVVRNNLGDLSYSLADYIIQKYRNVPYHNICHGLLVSFYAHAFSQELRVQQHNLEQIVALAGLFHDIGHSGYTNFSCGDKKSMINVEKNTHPLFCYLSFSQDDNKCKIQTNLQPKYAFKEKDRAVNRKSEIVESSINLNEDEFFYDNYLDLNSVNTLEADINTVVDYLKKFVNPKKKADGITDDDYYYIRNLCGTAELQHALIAKRILTKYKPTIEADFIEKVISSILLTNMAFYMGPNAHPHLLIEGNEYLELVHIADVIASGESVAGLKNENLIKVHKEFAQELDKNPDFYMGLSLQKKPFFFESQARFMKLIKIQVSELSSKFINGKLTAMVDEIQSTLRKMPIVKFKKIEKFLFISKFLDKYPQNEQKRSKLQTLVLKIESDIKQKEEIYDEIGINLFAAKTYFVSEMMKFEGFITDNEDQQNKDIKKKNLERMIDENSILDVELVDQNVETSRIFETAFNIFNNEKASEKYRII